MAGSKNMTILGCDGMVETVNVDSYSRNDKDNGNENSMYSLSVPTRGRDLLSLYCSFELRIQTGLNE